MDNIKKFIQVCDSSYGRRTCIYRYVSIGVIVELHVSHTSSEINVEAELINGLKVIILNFDDLVLLVGASDASVIKKEIDEIVDDYKNRGY